MYVYKYSARSRDIFSHYVFGKKLGEGSYAKVFEATDVDTQGKYFNSWVYLCVWHIL
jgi:hypothetical protein